MYACCKAYQGPLNRLSDNRGAMFAGREISRGLKDIFKVKFGGLKSILSLERRNVSHSKMLIQNFCISK